MFISNNLEFLPETHLHLCYDCGASFVRLVISCAAGMLTCVYGPKARMLRQPDGCKFICSVQPLQSVSWSKLNTESKDFFSSSMNTTAILFWALEAEHHCWQLSRAIEELCLSLVLRCHFVDIQDFCRDQGGILEEIHLKWLWRCQTCQASNGQQDSFYWESDTVGFLGPIYIRRDTYIILTFTDAWDYTLGELCSLRKNTSM